MPLAVWQPDFLRRGVASFADLNVILPHDVNRIAKLTQLPIAEVEQRFEEGNRIYVVQQVNQWIAYGWATSRQAIIGELGLTIQLDSANVYLWDFATLPAWRGKNVYPWLLQNITAQYANVAAQIWILSAPENLASWRGIERGGFKAVGDLKFLMPNLKIGFLHSPDSLLVQQAITIFQVERLENMIAAQALPCWHCAIQYREAGQQTLPACWTYACNCIAPYADAKSKPSPDRHATGD
jgi:GNAT superfamily N-acetyltransferase